MKIYLLDGEKVKFTDLVQVARREGYKPDDGLYLTSEAAKLLRENGHTVEEAQCLKREI